MKIETAVRKLTGVVFGIIGPMNASSQSASASNTVPIMEERPWGGFWVLQDEPHFKVKKLLVHPGHRLSLQLHHQREEHWVVVQGTPTITVGDQTWQAQGGEYIHIPTETRHRLENRGPEPVEIIEVQRGSYFGEDDIVRYDDDYNRL